MTKIHLIGSHYSLNKGWAAIVISTVDALRQYIPDAEFTLESMYPAIDSKAYPGVNIVTSTLSSKLRATHLLIRAVTYGFFKFLGLNLDCLIKIEELERYLHSDIILHLGGDTFCAEPFRATRLLYAFQRNIIYFTGHIYLLLFGLTLRKPVVIYAHSVGPFGVFRPLLKFILNKMALITVRDPISRDYLIKIGVNRPQVFLVADPAFLLKPIVKQSFDFLKERTGRGFVGISISEEAVSCFYKGEEPFIRLMSRVVEFLRQSGFSIIFIPHSIGGYKFGDDRVYARKIYELLEYKDHIINLESDYTPNELKGIIEKCDLFIGMRMHANIAALSSLVPTIAISHSLKYEGIMKTLGQEEWVCDIRTLDYEILTSKISNIIQKQKEIVENLKPKIEISKELVLLNAKLIKQLLDKRKLV